MRRLFGRRHGSVYPIKTCHFCCVESWIVPPHPIQVDEDEKRDITFSSSSRSISTGSIGNWFCSSCQCWNRADKNQIGGIATWDQKMNDENQNKDNFQKRAISTSTLALSIDSSFPSISPFCHSCQTNQTLILSILANGEDVDEMDDGAIQEWQASLESRYPPVCSQCHDIVVDRIESADKTARRLIWNGWLKRSRARGTPTSRQEKRLDRSSSADGQGGFSESLACPIWALQCLAFLAGAVIGVITSWRSIDLRMIEQGCLIGALLLCHMISSHWDPTLPIQQRLKKRLSPESSVKVMGRNRFQKDQNWLLVIRLIVLSLPFANIVSQSTRGIYHNLQVSLFTFVTTIQCIVLIDAFVHLHVIQPYNISLKSRISHLNSTRVNDAFLAEPALDLLSLESTRNPSKRQDRGGVNQIQDEKEEMDWSPTPDTSLIGNDFQLGPQRFFEPDRKTGLEDLLQTQLALEERRASLTNAAHKVAAAAASSKWTISIVAIAITLFAVLAVTILGPSQMKDAFHQLSTFYAPVTLKKQTQA